MGSREFFEQADSVFYRWNAALHTPEAPFGRIYDYEQYRGKSVLEIGCGMGCMAMNWAQRGAHIIAADLNPLAVEQTRRRFRLFGLRGEVLEADARRLPFADEAFSFVYSWGVLHHSPRIEDSIAECRRVLKRGGRLGIMLYNRRSLLYRYLVEHVEGRLNMERAFLTPLELASRYTDGHRHEGNPHTWPVTTREARALLSAFEDVHVRVLGSDVRDVLNTMCPLLGDLLPRRGLEALARRWGWSLWITAARP
ncbi:MAG TPA: class I SAM-dependent methyltransferase [Chloroflexota bacterium]|nr:class I SAM-dependent methyltransferase [Chloroflexota bacterium]